MIRRGAGWLTVVAFGCTGSGSDIGPDIPDPPESSFRSLVRDDADRGVAAATVEVIGASAATDTRGRADLDVAPVSRQIVRITGTNASARNGDILGSVAVATDLDGRALPFVVNLPDVSGSPGEFVQAGVLPATVTLTDTATPGATVTIPAGSSIGLDGSSATLRLGSIQPYHLPEALPPPSVGRWVTGSGLYVDPPDLTITPAGTLTATNELGLPASSPASLFRLDPLSGEWGFVAPAMVDGSGAQISSAGVVGGGLYCFATAVMTETTMTGRVVDATGFPVAGARVRASQAFTRTGADGRFVLGPIGAVDGQGANRTVLFEVHGGRDNFPVGRTAPLTLGPPTIDIGDFLLDTKVVALVRMMPIYRGRITPQEVLRLSSSAGLTLGEGIVPLDGTALLDEQWLGNFSFTFAANDPRQFGFLIALEGFATIIGPGFADMRVFMQQSHWLFGNSGGTATFALDRFGTGRVGGAGVVVTDGAGTDRFVLTTTDSVIPTVFYPFGGQATGSVQTTADGRTVTSASTVHSPGSARVELGLERANRLPLGEFARHGVAVGTLPAQVGNSRQLRPIEWSAFDAWFADTVENRGSTVVTPIDADPSAIPTVDYAVGIPVGGGNLAIAEGDTTGGGFELQRYWMFPSVDVASGGRSALTAPPPLIPTDSFPVLNALTGLDPSIPATSLAFDYGVRLPDRNVIDVARGVTGNRMDTAPNSVFSLPSLTGSLDGATHLLAFGGSSTTGTPPNTTTISQRSFVEISSASGADVSLLPAPVITSPAPGAAVPATGFQVTFSVPPETLFTEIELVLDTPTAKANWSAVLPSDQTSFSFRVLPAPAVTPLTPGAWRLKITANRAETGALAQGGAPYQQYIARRVAMSMAELNFNGISSVEIPLTLQ